MWIRKLFDSLSSGRSRLSTRPSRRGPQGQRPSHGRLAVEPLEDRCTPAVVLLAVGDITIVEGNDGAQEALVRVTLSASHNNSITVDFSTVDGTATAGVDYTAVSGKLTFA